jgi:hypothetical protein
MKKVWSVARSAPGKRCSIVVAARSIAVGRDHLRHHRRRRRERL